MEIKKIKFKEKEANALAILMTHTEILKKFAKHKKLKNCFSEPSKIIISWLLKCLQETGQAPRTTEQISHYYDKWCEGSMENYQPQDEQTKLVEKYFSSALRISPKKINNSFSLSVVDDFCKKKQIEKYHEELASIISIDDRAEYIRNFRLISLKEEDWLICAKDVAPENTSWFVQDFLLNSKLQLLVGQEGDGKSAFVAKVIACISNGTPLVKGERAPKQGYSLICSSEDAISDGWRPRIEVNGGDINKVLCINKNMFFGSSLELIDKLNQVRKKYPELRLVVLDPITQFIRGNLNDQTAVREGLLPLVEWSDVNDCTILGISHLSKRKDLPIGDQNIGSKAFNSVPRLVWTSQKEIEEDEEGNLQETGRVFLYNTKKNQKACKAISFYGEEDSYIGTNKRGKKEEFVSYKIIIEGRSDATFEKNTKTVDKQKQLFEEIIDFLKTQVVIGRKKVSEIKKELEEEFVDVEFHRMKMKRLKNKAGLLSKKIQNEWYWIRIK